MPAQREKCGQEPEGAGKRGRMQAADMAIKSRLHRGLRTHWAAVEPGGIILQCGGAVGKSEGSRTIPFRRTQALRAGAAG